MWKVKVPVIVTDITQDAAVNPVEAVDVEGEFFLDGPVAEQVAIIDFDDKGSVVPGVAFKPDGVNEGRYAVDPRELTSRDLTRVSVFGTVMRTLRLYEDDDAMGRPMRWAFDGPQLLVLPHAGQWENAFYERTSRSLQFFWFRRGERTIFTSRCHDIVAHETAHAILDGIAPELYHAITPQSLALHESVADLTALLVAFDHRELRNKVLERTGGSIRKPTEFSAIAEEFGSALDPHKHALRNLSNTIGLGDLPDDEPHLLSEVLSGALYSVLVRLHEELREHYARDSKAEPIVVNVESDRPYAQDAVSAAAKALFVAGERFKRTIFRGLDYLPPGEISFIDFARAIIAADQASHPDSPAQREWLREEFMRRGITNDPSQLVVRDDFPPDIVAKVDLETLVTSDWAAYELANRLRDFLAIPPDAPFRVWPRLDATKQTYRREGLVRTRECLFKVSWSVEEDNSKVGGPSKRQLTAGTTLAIDWETRRVRALLTSDPLPFHKSRDRMLRRLIDRDLLKFGGDFIGPMHAPLYRSIRADVIGDVMRVNGTARMLHVAAEAAHE